MLELLWFFIREVDELCGRWFQDSRGPRCDDDTWIAVNEMEIAIYRCLFRDGDFLEYAWHLAVSYARMAEAYMSKGDGDISAQCWLKAAEFVRIYESVPAYAKHTSYLVSRLVYDESNMGLHGACGSPEDYLEQMKSTMYDPIRESAEFIKAREIMENCPRNLRIRDERDFARFNG